MTQTLNPYLNFRGDARAAMEFYRDVFGGDLDTLTFTQGGLADQADDPEQLMHAQLETPAGFTLMGSDVPRRMAYERGDNQFSVSVSGDDARAIRGYWAALADGATVSMPLGRAPWGAEFGMLTDRFGVPWLVNITASAG